MSFLRIVASVLIAGAAHAASEPAPAQVTKLPDGKAISGNVTSETMEGLRFVTAEGAETPYKHGEYLLEYKSPGDDVDFLKARNAVAAKDYAKAMESYRGSLAKSKYDWVRETSALGIAQCAQQLKKPDDGIAAIQGLEKEYPKSVRLPEALLIKARLLADKGDKAEAVKVLTALAGHDKDWGVREAAKGATGLAEIQLSDQKFADVATMLGPWLTKLARYPDDFATIGLLLAQAQAGSSAAPAAMDTLRAVAFAPTDANLQARAHVEWSKLLAAKGEPADLLSAFDHAAIASALKGVDAPLRGEALKQARDLVPKIVAAAPGNEDAKNKVKIEYTTYLSKLQ